MGFATTLLESRMSFEKSAKRCVGRNRQGNRSRPGLRGTRTIGVRLQNTLCYFMESLPRLIKEICFQWC